MDDLMWDVIVFDADGGTLHTEEGFTSETEATEYGSLAPWYFCHLVPSNDVFDIGVRIECR